MRKKIVSKLLPIMPGLALKLDPARSPLVDQIEGLLVKTDELLPDGCGSHISDKILYSYRENLRMAIGQIRMYGGIHKPYFVKISQELVMRPVYALLR